MLAFHGPGDANDAIDNARYSTRHMDDPRKSCVFHVFHHPANPRGIRLFQPREVRNLTETSR